MNGIAPQGFLSLRERTKVRANLMTRCMAKQTGMSNFAWQRHPHPNLLPQEKELVSHLVWWIEHST
jgi:hypothetical protein